MQIQIDIQIERRSKRNVWWSQKQSKRENQGETTSDRGTKIKGAGHMKIERWIGCKRHFYSHTEREE